MNDPKCPKCGSEYTYPDGNMWVCPTCSHEWVQAKNESEVEPVVVDSSIRDAHGQILQSGDSVVVVKELKVKGASSAIKIGTKIKNIRLTDGDDGHNISCKVDGFGAMNLKSEFVKKA